MTLTDLGTMFGLTLIIELRPGGQWVARFDPPIAARVSEGSKWSPAHGFGDTPTRAAENLAAGLTGPELLISVVPARPPVREIWRSADDERIWIPRVLTQLHPAGSEMQPIQAGQVYLRCRLPPMFHVEQRPDACNALNQSSRL